MKHIVFGFVLLAFGVGAGLALQGQQVTRAELSADDLAQALGIQWWNIELPQDRVGEPAIGMEIVRPGGREELSGSSNWRSDSAKLFLWKMGKTLHYSLIGEGQTTRSTEADPFEGMMRVTASRPVGSTIRVGEIALVSGMKSAAITNDNSVSEGQIGIGVFFSTNRARD